MHRQILALSAFTALCACLATAQPQTNAQGWTPKQQEDWYYATQGSRLIPLSWLRALEQADNSERFLDPDFIRSFGLLVDDVSAEGLPVGFARDDNDDSSLTVSKLRWFAGQGSREKWVGLNCSACHTAELEYNGTKVRIDGGPSLFDFQSFIEALDAALRATGTDSAKFNKFATKIFPCKNKPGQPKCDPAKLDTPENRQKLREELGKLIAWEDRVDALNETPLRYGRGRVDAFGHIFNKIALFSGAARPVPNPADAPVSYPFLWDIYRHDKLQWNGIASNQRLSLGGGKYLDYGALGRNSGEVIGVFGDVAVRTGAGLGGYRSSIWADNLIRLETQLSTLKAPAWPTGFPAVNTDLAFVDTANRKSGRTLFSQHCKSCHQPRQGTEPYKVVMMPLTPDNLNSTDPWMACNAIGYRSPTGRLQGTPKSYIGTGERFGPDAPLAEMLETTVKGAMVGKKGQIVAQTARIFFGLGGAPRVVTEEVPEFRQARLEACYAANSPYMAYKARPLDGIWATAPYLHNGSVPTLYHLLDPARRPAEFRVGTRQYDTDRVGYQFLPNASGNVFTFKARDAQKNPIPGNSNEGHDYGASGLSPEQRRALLEYLKTL